jgi:hypothetical protein
MPSVFDGIDHVFDASRPYRTAKSEGSDMRTRMTIAALVALTGLTGPAAFADPAASTLTTSILGQLVSFTLPGGFDLQKEQGSRGQYFRAALPKGETADTWSQMINITGVADPDADPKKTAQFIAANIASSIQRLCPDTFAVKPLGPSKIDATDAFVAVTSCGKVGDDKHSETALTVAIKSAGAVYTIQWAERTPSNAENLAIDEAKWKGRLMQMVPFHVCPVVEGEKPPYPSCAKK